MNGADISDTYEMIEFHIKYIHTQTNQKHDQGYILVDIYYQSRSVHSSIYFLKYIYK